MCEANDLWAKELGWDGRVIDSRMASQLSKADRTSRGEMGFMGETFQGFIKLGTERIGFS